jgi:hypothetical protein
MVDRLQPSPHLLQLTAAQLVSCLLRDRLLQRARQLSLHQLVLDCSHTSVTVVVEQVAAVTVVLLHPIDKVGQVQVVERKDAISSMLQTLVEV